MIDVADHGEDLDDESAAAEAWLDSPDPSTIRAEVVPQEVQDVGRAVEALRRAQDEVDAAVERARAAGASWNALALPLGVSRQVVRQQYARHEASASA